MSQTTLPTSVAPLAGAAPSWRLSAFAPALTSHLEALFGAVLASTPDPIFVKDREGRYLVANEPAGRLLGVAAAALVGRTDAEIAVLGGHGAAVELDCEVLRTGVSATVESDVAIAGELRTYVTTKSALRDACGAIVGVVGLARDVTEARRTEARVKLLADAGALLGSSLDHDATLSMLPRLVVPALGDMCAVHLLRGDELHLVSIAHVESWRVDASWDLERGARLSASSGVGPAEAIRTGEPQVLDGFSEEQIAQLAPNDAHRAFIRELGVRATLCVPMRCAGKIVGALSVAVTDSPRRYAPSDVFVAQELAARAATAIHHADLYGAEQRARAAAQKAVCARDAFLAMAAHDLRTPVAAMKLQVTGLVRLAEREGAPGRMPERLQRLASHTRRLSRLIGNLLDASRILNGQLEVQREQVDLAAVARGVAEELRDELARARCVLEVQTPEHVVGVWDRARLEQVVVSLLGNAMKYARGAPLTLTVAATPDSAQLTLHDRGIGIAEEDQARIFERFERAAPDRHYGGLGVGLWVVRHVVESMGGRISVASAPGLGSTFVVDLPRGIAAA